MRSDDVTEIHYFFFYAYNGPGAASVALGTRPDGNLEAFVVVGGA